MAQPKSKTPIEERLPARRFGWRHACMVEPATSHRDDYASRLSDARKIGRAVKWALRASKSVASASSSPYAPAAAQKPK